MLMVGWEHGVYLGTGPACILLILFVPAAIQGERPYRHQKHDVHMAGFFPTSHGYLETSIGQGVLPAVKLAIRHVNKSPLVLPHHRVKMHWNNTACNPGVGLKSLFDVVHGAPRKVILFGDACSNVTETIAKAARHWNLVQVTYADTHPMFTPRSFPHFFRVVPSENNFNQPRLALLRQFNWTRVGTIYQNQARYSLAHNDLIMKLEKNKFDVVASLSFNDELTNQLDTLIEKDVRIILANFNETWARVVFCDAYKKNIYGDKFQWLIVGMYEAQWWNSADDSLDCTPQQILTALNGTLVVEVQTISSQLNTTTISGKTPVEYEQEYFEEALKWGNNYLNRQELGRERRNIMLGGGASRRDMMLGGGGGAGRMKREVEEVVKQPPHIYSRFHGYAYDGIWAIALAIHRVNEEAIKQNQTMQDFQYRDVAWEERFIRALNHTSFQGVTGSVQFKENSRRGTVLINQIIGDEERCVGEYSGVTRTLHMERCQSISWARVPKDRTVTRLLLNRVDLTIYTLLVIISSLGIVLGLVFLGVNIKFRHQKQIKMSSPNLNNLIIIGSIMSYISVGVLGLDSTMTSEGGFPYVCAGKAYILMAGFTLSFGSMFAKTYRVHSIFSNVQLNKKVMKDAQLYLIVGILLAIDIIVMTTWQVADPFFRDIKDLRPYSPHGDVDVLIIPRNEYCKSTYMNIFVGIIYAYKGLLMVFGAFLAWETRNVQIPALNDSKYVGMSVYNVFIMCVLGVAISFVLNENQNASFIIISVFIIFCTTGTLCLVFVPKIIELRRDPLGVSAQEKPNIRSGANKVKSDSAMQNLEDKLRIANKVKNKYLEQQVEKSSMLQSMCREVGNEHQQLLHPDSSGPGKEEKNTHSVEPKNNQKIETSEASIEKKPLMEQTKVQPAPISEPPVSIDAPPPSSVPITNPVNGGIIPPPALSINTTSGASTARSDSTTGGGMETSQTSADSPPQRLKDICVSSEINGSVVDNNEKTADTNKPVVGCREMKKHSAASGGHKTDRNIGGCRKTANSKGCEKRRSRKRHSHDSAHNHIRLKSNHVNDGTSNGTYGHVDDGAPNGTHDHVGDGIVSDHLQDEGSNHCDTKDIHSERLDNQNKFHSFPRKSSCQNTGNNSEEEGDGWNGLEGWACSPPPPPGRRWCGDTMSTCSCEAHGSLDTDIHHHYTNSLGGRGRRSPYPPNELVYSHCTEKLHCSHSVGDQLNFSVHRTYYRVEGGVEYSKDLEDVCTQTDDEDMEEERIPRHNNGFKNEGSHFGQVRSEEELISSCQKYNKQVMNGLVHNSSGGSSSIPGQRMDTHAPIFKRLVQDDSSTEGGAGAEPGTRYQAKLLSCPNIAVRCDIVEYL